MNGDDARPALLQADERLLFVHRRQRFTMLVARSSTGAARVLKLGRDAAADEAIRAEFRLLDDAVQRGTPAPRAPRPVREGSHGQRRYSVVTYVTGRKALLLGARDERQIRAAFAAADDIAATLPPERAVPTAGMPILLMATSGLASAAAAQPLLDAVHHATAAWQARVGAMRPAALSHGDFTAANLLYGDNGEVQVIDWSNATVQGWPLVDHLTLALHLWTKYDGLTPDAVARAVLDGRDDSLGRALARAIERVDAGVVVPALATAFVIRALRLAANGREAQARDLARAASGTVERA